VELIVEKEKKTKGFRVLCTDLTKKIVRGGMNLENYLIMPIQRLPRYAMLLRELEKATIDVHPDKGPLGAAAQKMEEKLKELDSVIVNSKPVRKDSRSSSSNTKRVSIGNKSAARSSSPAGLGASSEKLKATSHQIPQRSVSAMAPSTAGSTTAKRISSSSSSSSSRRNSSKRLSYQSDTDGDDDDSDMSEDGQSYFSFAPTSGPSSRRSSARESKRSSRKKKVTDQARRESMVFYTTEMSMEALVIIHPPADVVVENPILLEGYVIQKPGGLLRRMVLSKDRMVIFHVPNAEGAHEEDLWDMVSGGGASGGSELPRALYSYELAYLRFEKEGAAGLMLFDTRQDNDQGHLFHCESVKESNVWIDTLFDAIYAE
jgi:hypothetical protein